MELTPSQQTLLDQIIWLHQHFEAKYGIEAFSQSNAQFESKLGLSRKTIQTGIQKLESLGIIEVARNAGFKGANLIFLHTEKLATSFESFSSKAREAFKKALQLGSNLATISVSTKAEKQVQLDELSEAKQALYNKTLDRKQFDLLLANASQLSAIEHRHLEIAGSFL